MMPKPPPRFVPTLTHVVASPRASASAQALENTQPALPTTSLPAGGATHTQLSAEDLAQQMRQILLVRTRQYMEVELQRRIRETVSQLALEHAHKLFEEIQPKLENTISKVVDEAIQQAIAHAATHAP